MRLFKFLPRKCSMPSTTIIGGFAGAHAEELVCPLLSTRRTESLLEDEDASVGEEPELLSMSELSENLCLLFDRRPLLLPLPRLCFAFLHLTLSASLRACLPGSSQYIMIAQTLSASSSLKAACLSSHGLPGISSSAGRSRIPRKTPVKRLRQLLGPVRGPRAFPDRLGVVYIQLVIFRLLWDRLPRLHVILPIRCHSWTSRCSTLAHV